MLNLQIANESVDFYKAGLFCCFQYVFKISYSLSASRPKPVIFSFKVEPDKKYNGDLCGYEGS